MTVAEQISLWSAIVAFASFVGSTIFAIVACFARSGAKRQAQRANDIATGQSETALREAIAMARQRIEDAALRITELVHGRKADKLPAQEKRRLDGLERLHRAAVENYLNAYEDACGKYIDRKIDRGRFKKAFIREVEKLCDPKHKSYKRLMHPKSTSNYEAIWKVYDEWHRHEN